MLLGIDLGGTNIAAGITDDDGKIIKKTSVPLGSAKNSADEMADKMAALFDELSVGEEITSVGIGSPGIVNSDKGTVIYASNIAFSNYPLAEEMEKRTGKRVKVVNDGNAAVFAEVKCGAAKGMKNVVMLTLGTGVGGGIVIDGKIYSGSFFGAGEVGHIVIEKGGRKCPCGRRGCFERYASATGLIETSRNAALKYPSSLLAKESEITGMTAFSLARRGDAAAAEAVENYISDLAEGTASLITLFSPDAIVIGGGVSNEGDPLFLPLKKKVRELLSGNETPVLRASMGANAGIIGAALAGK